MTSEASPPAPERKSPQTFALHALFGIVLLWLLPSLDAAYAYGFKTVGNWTVGSIGEVLRVEYRWVPPQERGDHGEIEMVGFVGDADEPAWESSYALRVSGYRPSTILIALILATPAPRMRRALGAVGGVLAFNAFFLAQGALLSASLFALVAPAQTALAGPLAAAHPAIRALFQSPVVRYTAVFVLWMVIAAPARGIDTRALRERADAWLRR